MKMMCKCGQPIEYDAEQGGYTFACPNCGIGITLPKTPSPPALPQKKRLINKMPLIAISILAAFICVGTVVIFLNQDSNNQPEHPLPPARIFGKPGAKPESKEIVAKIKASSTQLQIVNAGERDWSGVDVYINGQPPFSKCYKGLSVPAGGTQTIDLAEFSDRNGKRFNPFAEKVVTVWIGGHGFDYYSFSF